MLSCITAFEQDLVECANSLLAHAAKLSTDEERANAVVKHLSSLSNPMERGWVLLVDNLTPACESKLLHKLWYLPFGSVIATSKQSLAPALADDYDPLTLSQLDPEPATAFVFSGYKGKSELSSSGSCILSAFVSDRLQCIPLKCHLARAVLLSISYKSQSSSADEAVQQLLSTFNAKCFDKAITRGGAQDYTQDRLLSSMVELLVTDTLPALCRTTADLSSDADAERLAANAVDLLLMICYTTPERGLSVAMFSEAGIEQKQFRESKVLEISIQLLEQVGLASCEERDSAAWGHSTWLKVHESVQVNVFKQLRQHPSFVPVLKIVAANSHFLAARGPHT